MSQTKLSRERGSQYHTHPKLCTKKGSQFSCCSNETPESGARPWPGKLLGLPPTAKAGEI